MLRCKMFEIRKSKSIIMGSKVCLDFFVKSAEQILSLERTLLLIIIIKSKRLQNDY